MEEVEATHLPFAGYGSDLAREVCGGIRSELASSRPEQTLDLSEGGLAGEVDGRPYWSFGAPIDPMTAPNPETPVELQTVDGELLDATIVAFGDDSVTVVLDTMPAGPLVQASMRVDASFVLTKLRDRVSELGAAGADLLLIDELLSPEQLDGSDGGGSTEEPTAIAAAADQERAAGLAVEPGVRFTWGPPGTGKTKVLGMAVDLAARRGDSVLVLAHANAAVDVAAARIAAELSEEDLVASGAVLRVGSPLPTSTGLEDLLPTAVADRQSPELAQRRVALNGQRTALSDQLRNCDDAERPVLTERLHEVRRELVSLERAQLQAVRELVGSASVLVTTLARAIIDDAIWAREWDVVMVDEASMAPLPMVLALAMRGPTTLSVLGDPRQLPPVHRGDEPEAKLWFGRDLFAYAGFGDPGHDPLRDPRLSTLRIQFRMGEAICAAVDEFAYGGLLRTDSTARNLGIRLAETRPGQSSELVIVDTAGIGAQCWTDPVPDSFSRLNPTSALVSASVGAELLESGCSSVALVSPYRAQVRWLDALAASLDGAQASTVHRLQGSEADAVVLDLTDAGPHTKPSRLTGEDAELAQRLLTVAASRARGKLVVVADVDFIEERVALNGPLRRFLDALDLAGVERTDVGELAASWAGRWLGAVQWHEDWSVALGAVPDDDRSSGPVGTQPWLVGGDVLVLGSASGEGPAAVVRNRRVVEAFRVGVAGVGTS